MDRARAHARGDLENKLKNTRFLFMKSFEEIYQNEKSFLSLTSLYPDEFDQLLAPFAGHWYQHHKHFDTFGKRRKAPKPTYENDTRTLPKVTDKLFFILLYLKQNPLQEMLAFMFEMDQATVNRWIKTLSKILAQALAQLKVLPCRDGQALINFLNNNLIDCLIIDAMEQRTKRAIDMDAQKDKYSGKKKTIR